MSGKYVQVDMTELEEFINSLHGMSDDLKKELELYLEAAGDEMLRIIQDKIIDVHAVDTSRMIASFSRTDRASTSKPGDNIFEQDSRNLSVNVGSNVYYTKFVNDGHMAGKNPTTRRFVEGRHFIESATKDIEKILPESLEKKLDQWIENYFG